MSNTVPSVGRQTGAERPGLADFLGSIIALLLVFVPLLYYLVWRNLTSQTSVIWITLGLLVTLLALVWIIRQARVEEGFERMHTLLSIILMVLGAAAVSFCFEPASRTVVFKLFVVTYFSILPGLLYVIFVSVKGRTLWDEYVFNLYRLHVDRYEALPESPAGSTFRIEWERFHWPVPGSSHSGTVKAQDKNIYQKKFEGHFWSLEDGATAFRALRGEKLWPVALATLLIAVGWILVVDPGKLGQWELLPFQLTRAGNQQIPLEAFRFAFLGAYFYVLQMLVRRYFQNDLKPGAYVNAIMRIIVVILLVWAIDQVWPSHFATESEWALAFVIGVFPQIGWQALQNLVKAPFKLVLKSLRQQYPLSELDGMNIWYESRLMEEGIEDLQNLATANFVDLMLNTRIPVERLVDWVDQAILFLHLGKKGKGEEESDRDKLRKFGIRTATDLEDAFSVHDSGLTDKLQFVLNSGPREPSVLRTILSTLKREPNFYHVRQWKNFTKLWVTRAQLPQQSSSSTIKSNRRKTPRVISSTAMTAMK